ncbi:hypothetical protein BGP_6396 [Beggiatoa sp. PS]|nr:hypothetical protein BGP_6396 [Beggiatoa sp. PS]
MLEKYDGPLIIHHDTSILETTQILFLEEIVFFGK